MPDNGNQKGMSWGGNVVDLRNNLSVLRINSQAAVGQKGTFVNKVISNNRGAERID